MTVKNLIDKLQDLPQDAIVTVELIDYLGASREGDVTEVFQTPDGEYVCIQSV